MTGDYLHWHHLPGKPGSEYTLPQSCCVEAIDSRWRRRLDDAVHAERRRIILEAAAAVTAYGEAALSVLLDHEQARIVRTVLTNVVNAVKRTGCICPARDTATFADPMTTGLRRRWEERADGTWGPAEEATMPGRDSRCGIHDKAAT